MSNSNFPPLSTPAKHSRLGMTSLIVAILVFMIVDGDMAVILFYRNESSLLRGFATLDSLLTGLTFLLTLVGLGLGLTAVIQKEAKRVFGILGLVSNALFLLTIVAFYAINVLTMIRAAGT
jgi:hypothetical protein